MHSKKFHSWSMRLFHWTMDYGGSFIKIESASLLLGPCIQKIKNKENRIFRSMPLRIWIGGRLWSFNYQKFSVTRQSLQHAGHRKSLVSLFKSFPSVCTLLFDGEHLRNILNSIASGVSRAEDYWEYLE